MGRTVQIRVVAQSDDKALEDRWPRLVALAWAQAPAGTGRGVLQLVKDLSDRVRFALIEDKAVCEALAPGLERATALVAELETALGDWKPGEANATSEQLEECLDDLEGLAPERPFVVSSRNK